MFLYTAVYLCNSNNLMVYFVSVDYRVAPLVLMVKQWASHSDINDASQGTLSSYSLVLMVLNYLQGRYCSVIRVFKYYSFS